MRVAVMQPYFYPYLLYYHLIACVDLFVVFDCVQFPRRGRVHRAPLPGSRWLTLPLARQDRATRIADLEFAPEADGRWAERLAGMPWLDAGLRAALAPPLPRAVCPWLVRHLELACSRLGVHTPILRSSTLALAQGLRGQDRVIAAVTAVGGRDYVNLPGGRALYDPAGFARAGLGLSFLPGYDGAHLSMLHALATEPEPGLRAALHALPGPDKVTT